jgi:uroporphyrinogen decarboxylase
MRQAGRYLPQFRALRAKYDFLTLCRTPELVAEVTSQPIDYLGVDAAILFCDILVVLDAMDRGLHFDKGVGPVIDRPIHSSEEIAQLHRPDVADSLSYVADGIKACKERISVPLIGFCGAPFTVASYLIEGGGSRDYKRTKQWIFRDPKGLHALLSLLCDVTIDYCKLQIEAGVQALQVFDSWAHLLAQAQFEEFSLHYLKRIVDALRPTGIPVILFCRGSSFFAEQLASLQPAAISIDWSADLSQLSRKLPSNIALQGNLDPDILYADKSTIERECKKLLNGMKDHPGYIFNLGHGLKPDMEPENVRCLVDTVRNS